MRLLYDRRRHTARDKTAAILCQRPIDCAGDVCPHPSRAAICGDRPWRLSPVPRTADGRALHPSLVRRRTDSVERLPALLPGGPPCGLRLRPSLETPQPPPSGAASSRLAVPRGPHATDRAVPGLEAG